jgi:PadR family transcriptional regulator, regulatory protein AphA
MYRCDISLRYMSLSPTGYVILGMLRHEPRTGYEIKQAVDRSTRFFWAASYGQIYPELRRLAKAGLVEGEADPKGERKRTVYRLTRAGRTELRRWLAEDPAVLEIRDESLLKLFFAAAAPPRKAAEIIAARRRAHEQKLERLREIEPFAAASSEADPYPYMVLRFGLASSEWVVRWCDEALAELDEEGRGAQPRRQGRPDAG